MSIKNNSLLSWQERAIVALIAAGKAKRLITYADLANAANIPSPQRIHKLTTWLEDTIREDQTKGLPLRAAVVVSRNRGKLPAPGFFMLCRELGLYRGPVTGPEAAQFHRTMICDLFSNSSL